MKTMPKIIAFDLDGTLAESKQQLNAEMAALLSRLSDITMLAVISGASFEQFESQFIPWLPESFNLSRLYLLPTNAGSCYAYKERKWEKIYDESLTEEEKKRVLIELNSALEELDMTNPKEKVYGERIEDRGTQITFSGLGQEAPADEKKKWDPDRKKRTPLYAMLLEKLPEFSIGMNAATSIDITRRGVNKAFGIRKLSELTTIPISEMVYVGDALDVGGNDNIVLDTGIKTHEVFNPQDTASYIRSLL